MGFLVERVVIGQEENEKSIIEWVWSGYSSAGTCNASRHAAAVQIELMSVSRQERECPEIQRGDGEPAHETNGGRELPWSGR